MVSSTTLPPRNVRRLLWSCGCVVAGLLLQTAALQSMLQQKDSASCLFSEGLWRRIVTALGGSLETARNGNVEAEIDFVPLFVFLACVTVVCWLLGALWIATRTTRSWSHALADWGIYGWLWWLIAGAWEVLRVTTSLLGLHSLNGLLRITPQFCESLVLAGWLATFLTLSRRRSHAVSEPSPATDSPRVTAAVWIAVAVYVVVFTAMNWQLYRGLLVPHGDSAMYEEHLWNVWHGKGFRSYLDQGLFLGEHIQVIHLLLLPLHVLWPSHLMLELCESLALGIGAIPVFWMARRHTGSDRAAALLAIAYLLYFPMQFLDISIDLKTFRPISFGVPLFLFALDQLDRGRYRSMLVLLLLALSAKEDYALVIAPLGLWIAAGRTPAASRFRLQWGFGIALFGAVYLVVATRVVIPWFRGGEELHYARYFSKFGNTLGEIAWTMLTNPALLFSELFSTSSIIYGLAILLPLGFVPLLSPGRLLVGLPLFGLLCLNEIARDSRHHFHAHLVPVVLWAAAAGLARARPVWKSIVTKPGAEPSSESVEAAGRFAAHFVCMCALATGLFLSLNPLGIAFWDSASSDTETSVYWRTLYVPAKRATLLSQVLELIPRDSRVASTDFVHTRLTHYERSYDYSDYLRRVSDYEHKVPDDTDYIVIDTQHKYSTIKRPEEIRELRKSWDKWKLLAEIKDDAGVTYFIVLERIRG